jgi:polyisoprenoid-binding protein YceI
MFNRTINRYLARTASLGVATLLLAVAATLPGSAAQRPAKTPLTIDSARISIAGTTNLHGYEASTTAVRIIRAQLSNAAGSANIWDDAVKPGGLEAFEISIPALKLSSPTEGVDKNMYKALKAEKYPDITFRLRRIDMGAAGALKALGTLGIAGVEREVTFDLKTRRSDATLTVTGELQLLMTDYGITPPKAMLGMLKTDPKVTVTFEAVLAVPIN